MPVAAPVKLADHFVRCTGMAPMQYLTQWRLRVAADSLAHSDQAIQFVAESAGFGSTPAFTRAFKREFGDSPAKWIHGLPLHCKGVFRFRASGSDCGRYIRIWTPAPVQDSAQQGGDRDCIRIFGFVVMRR